ncbi:acyl-CoA-like ligand-binding transcription factor [Salininema proteolyticum]|uniref:TetR family transcriptional regulator n=1 Tax=Salininema proteolyticum TaxID=1607685 RepID=A0ABV8TU23_9ACTN
MPDMTGLRERKKNATRHALAEAAFDIAVKDGLAAATPERIATEAGVSTRTFHNYFPNRDAAVVDHYGVASDRYAEILNERLGRQPLWTALRETFIDVTHERAMTEKQLQHCWELVRDHAELLSVLLGRLETLRERVCRVIAEHTGYHKDSAEISLVAGSAVVALRVGQEQWLARPETDLCEQIRSAFALLEGGLLAEADTPSA